MPQLEVAIETKDGSCPASIFTPANGSGPWPGVIFFMDGLGIRPVLREMGQRLADAGYAVLLPDAYYRFGAYPPMDPPAIFADPDKRAKLMEWVGSLSRERKVKDIEAYTNFFTSRLEVEGQKIRRHRLLHGRPCRPHRRRRLSGAFRRHRLLPWRKPRYRESG
jgi:carboxymethylenebutenolidase